MQLDRLVVDVEEKQAAIAWPLPVDARLEVLLDRARDAGERTTRKELTAAILAGADLSGANPETSPA